MVIADIVNEINLGSVVVSTTGSAIDISRITRKSVYAQALLNTSGIVTIEESADSTVWNTLGSRLFTSGTAMQSEVFNYAQHIPYIRTSVAYVSGTATYSTTVTGRGI